MLPTGILAHIEASRYQHLVTSYLATAGRLEDAAADSAQLAADPSSWSDFVNRCEDIIRRKTLPDSPNGRIESPAERRCSLKGWHFRRLEG